MSTPRFAEVWSAFQAGIEGRNQRLLAELESAWADLQAIVRAQTASFQNEPWPAVQPGKMASIRQLIDSPGKRLFLDALGLVRKARPQERALAALDAYHSGLEDLAGRLPQTVTIAGRELTGVLSAYSQLPLRHAWIRWRRKPAGLPLRRIVQLRLLTESEARAMLAGSYFLLLAKVSLSLLAPWQEVRRAAFRTLAGEQPDLAAFERDRVRCQTEMKVHERHGEEILERLTAWHKGASGRLAKAVLLGKRRISERRRRNLALRWQQHFAYWSRQQRAVRAVLELESDLADLTLQIDRSATDALALLDMEQDGLVHELDSVIQWLHQRQSGEASGEFPPPQTRLVPAEERAAAWERAVQAATRNSLPLNLEAIEPRWALPTRRSPWRQLEPQRVFLSALARAGRGTVLEGFQEAEAAHRPMVREIERAREVVDFSLEVARSEGEAGMRIAREGIANALALVSYQRQTAVDPHAQVEQKLVKGAASVIFLAHFALEQGRLGLLTYLVRQSGSQAARETWTLSLEKTSRAGRWTRDFLNWRYHRLLLKIGWEAPPVSAPAPVVSRGYLGDVLNLQFATRDLPMIYRRLFRLAPVEDPRFLVGREAEMAALAEARQLWASGRAVSVVLVGARGSGKTSLLNCALAAEFSDAPVIRSQFCERIADPARMRGFLRQLFHLPEDAELLETLLAQKAVVMVEELERTFLRRMNGFDGLRELLSIISATSGKILWILSLNQHSFRYLDAAVGLGQYFSHRINAMAVPPEHLQNAVLLRHNLSGLRLQYPPLPKSDPRISGLRRLLGLQREAEELFFDSLYRQSEGIFRSAFELWQQFMERVEGGVLYLKLPTEPDYDPLIAQLSLDDALTLQAVLQHGSLTERDHAEIFECPIERSRIRLERLLGLEFLEPEPLCPGFRIRPEAGRLVHTALHRLNLI